MKEETKYPINYRIRDLIEELHDLIESNSARRKIYSNKKVEEESENYAVEMYDLICEGESLLQEIQPVVDHILQNYKFAKELSTMRKVFTNDIRQLTNAAKDHSKHCKK